MTLLEKPRRNPVAIQAYGATIVIMVHTGYGQRIFLSLHGMTVPETWWTKERVTRIGDFAKYAADDDHFQTLCLDYLKAEYGGPCQIKKINQGEAFL